MKQMKMLENQITNQMKDSYPVVKIVDSFDFLSSGKSEPHHNSRISQSSFIMPNHKFIGGNRLGSSPSKKGFNIK
jgi:hypothetical protein